MLSKKYKVMQLYKTICKTAKNCIINALKSYV